MCGIIIFLLHCNMNPIPTTISLLFFLVLNSFNLNAQPVCSVERGYACVFVPSKDVGKIKLFYKDSSGNRFWNIWNIKQDTEKQGKHLVFAMNGGMYTPLYKPVGLYMEEGKVVAPINLKNGDNNFCWKPNGVFAIDNKGKAQVTVSEKFNASSIRFASQSGPMILINGKVHEGFEKSTSK